MLDHVLHPIRTGATAANWIYLAIGAGLVAVLRPFGRSDFAALAEWMNASIPVPRWLFGLCLTVGTTIGLIGVLALRVRVRADHPLQRGYVSDEFDGVRWRWGWRTEAPPLSVDIDTLRPSCAECGAELQTAHRYSDGIRHIDLHCRSCDKACHQLPLGTRGYETFLVDVKREIEHRAREAASS